MDAIRAHLADAYPEEGCGILGGAEEGGVRVVRHVIPVENRFEDPRARGTPGSRSPARRRRYLIAPELYIVAERDLAKAGLDVMGFFHSHPDCPPEPSTHDRDWAWPWYSYMIVSVRAGKPGDTRSWRLREDRSGFEEEIIESR